MKTHHFTPQILHFYLFHSVSYDGTFNSSYFFFSFVQSFLFFLRKEKIERKVWLLLLLSTFIIIQISQAVEAPKKSFFEAPPRITLEELKEKLDQKADVIVVDVRGNLSFEQERIKGAISIPLEEIEEGKREFPKDKEIVFY